MRHLITAFFLFLSFFVVFENVAQIRLGVKAGLNVNDIAYNYADEDAEPPGKMKLGFHVGVTSDFFINDMISVQPGLMFSRKGTRISYAERYTEDELELIYGEGVSSIEGYDYITLNYFEVPVNFVLKIQNFQILAGPYIGFGLGGGKQADYTLSLNDEDIEIKQYFRQKPVFGKANVDNLDDNEEPYRALDYGLNVGLGYKIGQIQANAAYSLGLSNLTPSFENSNTNPKDRKAYNRVISVSLSYYFW